MEIIKISNLTKEYKDAVAVDDVSFNIEKNELFALLGPNGAGKTTIIKMLACLIKPTSGNVSIDGYDILKDELQIKNNIAVSPQETAIARNLTVEENLMMITDICKNHGDIDEVIKKLNLTSVRKKLAKNLSGGNQRRLSIAMAIITKPKILFLDEPTLGLDIEARVDLWDYIKKLKENTTIILTTHYLEEADELSDRIGVIKNGKLIELGTSKYLKKKYGDAQSKLDDIYLKIIRGVK